jgi:5-methylthioribose kinase
MERWPVKLPGMELVNMTVMEQVAAGATLVPQLFVCAKELSVVIAEIVSDEFPVFVRKTVLDPRAFPLKFPKSRLYGTSFTVPTLIVSVALDVLVGSVAEVAVRVMEGFDGTLAGAA